MADLPQLPLLPTGLFLESSNPALDRESLLYWAHAMNAAIVDVNAWLEEGNPDMRRHSKSSRTVRNTPDEQTRSAIV